jgi:integrase
MPRPRPPHLHRQVTRHGKTVWYVRVGKGPRTRIRAEFGTAEFDAQYQAAIARVPRSSKAGAAVGSLAWLIDRYREVDAWRSLSLATRRQRENILRQVMESAGDKPYAAITAATIAAGRDRRVATPFQARHFLDTMRGLFEWARDAGIVKVNPAASVKYPTLKSGAGFPVWTEDDVAAYEAKWPLGTRRRVWIAVPLYTGLRRGDAVCIGRQHVRDGVATIKTQKTNTEVHLPILPALREVLEAGPTADLAFICGINGKPMTKESFGNAFADACRAAGVKKSAHGLRKIGATRAANNGATVAQLNAIFGWTGSKMAILYTENADRRRLAQQAIGKLVNETATSIPSPLQTVREPAQKAQTKQR